MAVKTTLKRTFARAMALPAVKGFIIGVGILVALIIGHFTLHAHAIDPDMGRINPETARLGHLSEFVVDTDNLQVTATPIVLVYDKNFDLVIYTKLDRMSPYEREHLNRLLNICELLVTNEETTIYWLDK